MTSRPFRPRYVGIERAQKAIRRQQRQDARFLRGAIVGRPLTLGNERTIDGEMQGSLHVDARYRKVGQIAAVYLFRDELREHKGKTYFNSIQVQHAIDTAGPLASHSIMISRGDLHLVEESSGLGDRKRFWVSAIAEQARSIGPSGRPISLRREELIVANELFAENMNTTGSPLLWLGALSAASTDAAQEALDVLEDVIPARLDSGPISLIPLPA